MSAFRDMASSIRISKPKENVGAENFKLKNLPWVIPGLVPNELSNYLMLKLNRHQRGYPIRPESDPNLGPECQTQCTIVSPSSVLLCIAVSSNRFSIFLDIHQAHFLCRSRRPLQ